MSWQAELKNRNTEDGQRREASRASPPQAQQILAPCDHQVSGSEDPNHRGHSLVQMWTEPEIKS